MNTARIDDRSDANRGDTAPNRARATYGHMGNSPDDATILSATPKWRSTQRRAVRAVLGASTDAPDPAAESVCAILELIRGTRQDVAH